MTIGAGGAAIADTRSHKHKREHVHRMRIYVPNDEYLLWDLDELAKPRESGDQGLFLTIKGAKRGSAVALIVLQNTVNWDKRCDFVELNGQSLHNK